MMHKLETLQAFLQVLALMDLFGFAMYVIMTAVALLNMNEKLDEIYEEFKKGEW